MILNPAMKILTQRRKGAKTRGLGTVRPLAIVHPASEQYFTSLPFLSPTTLRLCAFA